MFVYFPLYPFSIVLLPYFFRCPNSTRTPRSSRRRTVTSRMTSTTRRDASTSDSKSCSNRLMDVETLCRYETRSKLTIVYVRTYHVSMYHLRTKTRRKKVILKVIFQDSRELHMFMKSCHDVMTWLNAKLQMAYDETYLDPSNLQSKLKRHQAFSGELQANQVGNSLLQVHFMLC